MFKQFDIVQIVTTKSIRFLSGPEGHAATPNGNWSVVGFVGSDVVLSKDNTLVRVPLEDVRRVGSYNLDSLFKELTSAGYLKDESIDMTNFISIDLNINVVEAKKFLLKHNFKLNAKTIEERDIITKKVRTQWQKRKKNA